MPDFLVTFLGSILHEQGVPNPAQVAERAAAALRKVHVVNESSIKRAAIREDPETDSKILARRHQCSRRLIYKAWNEKG